MGSIIRLKIETCLLVMAPVDGGAEEAAGGWPGVGSWEGGREGLGVAVVGEGDNGAVLVGVDGG